MEKAQIIFKNEKHNLCNKTSMNTLNFDVCSG